LAYQISGDQVYSVSRHTTQTTPLIALYSTL